MMLIAPWRDVKRLQQEKKDARAPGTMSCSIWKLHSIAPRENTTLHYHGLLSLSLGAVVTGSANVPRRDQNLSIYKRPLGSAMLKRLQIRWACFSTLWRRISTLTLLSCAAFHSILETQERDLAGSGDLWTPDCLRLKTKICFKQRDVDSLKRNQVQCNLHLRYLISIRIRCVFLFTLVHHGVFWNTSFICVTKYSLKIKIYYVTLVDCGIPYTVFISILDKCYGGTSLLRIVCVACHCCKHYFWFRLSHYRLSANQEPVLCAGGRIIRRKIVVWIQGEFTLICHAFYHRRFTVNDMLY